MSPSARSGEKRLKSGELPDWGRAVVVGDIRIGDGVKIGAGAVVCTDVPEGCTVVASPSRILRRE